MNTPYFSDREHGPRPRTEQEVSDRVWGGLIAVASALISAGAFGIDFPEECPDGEGISGTNDHMMQLALGAEIPSLPWPVNVRDLPPTLAVMDFLEFCHLHVAEPIRGSYHSFFRHHHLSFDREQGQAKFRQQVNRIFSRSGVAFELQSNGQVQRLAPPILREALTISQFNTGDGELDAMLESARARFLNPDPQVRRESLEKLWDAWERVKTIEPAPDKKASIERFLGKAASEPKFRDMLDGEARELTRIGNTFQIRHSETSQVPLETDAHVDYLFHRLFSLIQLVLGAR